MFPVEFNDGQAVQAVDQNQHILAYAGYGVVSGCNVTIDTGTLGSGESTITVDSGTLLVDGVSTDETSVSLAVGESESDPRKDLVVYDVSVPEFTVIQGTAQSAFPSSETRQSTEDPSPPDLADSIIAVSEGNAPNIPIAEIWVGEAVISIGNQDIADRRQEVSPKFEAISAEEINGPVTNGSNITNLDGSNLFVNNGDLNAANMRTDVQDDGTDVVTNTTTLNFGSNISVTDPGDGSATIDGTDTDTNTHTDVSDDGATVVGSTDDINFAGNLSVTDDGDNSVTVDAEGGANTTIFMSDYSSGGVADTEFESAISDATSGDTIVFDRNSYELQNGHQISESYIIDQTEDAEVVCTNTANADSSIEFLGTGLTGTSTTTSSVVSPGTRSIPVNDSSGFSAGDDILVMDQAYAEQAAGPHQFLEIEAVPDGTTINVLGSVVRDFVSGANVYLVDLIEKPVIRNITTRGGGNRHLAFRWCKDPLFEGASVSEYLEQSLYALDCWRPRWKDVEAIDPEAIGSGQGEPLAVYRCSDAYIESPRIYDCRRGIDFAWGTHSVDVIDPIIHGADIAGISVHGDDICDNISIQGGTITNVPNATTGYGVINSASCSMSVEGVHFTCDRAGIANVGPMTASNCHFEPVGSSAQQAIQPVGSHGHYKNMVIKDPNNNFIAPVRVDTRNGDVRDIFVEADIEYTGQDAVIIDSDNSGNSITDVKIRGKVHGGTADQPIFLWAETGSLDEIDISMDVYGTAGQCIRLLADDSMGTVKVHDCTLESTDSACIFDSNELTGATIQINNCYLDSGSSGTTLSFNNGCENLFVLGSYISGSVDTSGTITNQVISDNLP